MSTNEIFYYAAVNKAHNKKNNKFFRRFTEQPNVMWETVGRCHGRVDRGLALGRDTYLILYDQLSVWCSKLIFIQIQIRNCGKHFNEMRVSLSINDQLATYQIKHANGFITEKLRQINELKTKHKHEVTFVCYFFCGPPG